VLHGRLADDLQVRQLSRAVNSRVAREDLLDEAGARSRHAEHQYRRLILAPGILMTRKKCVIECRSQSPEKILVFRDRVGCQAAAYPVAFAKIIECGIVLPQILARLAEAERQMHAVCRGNARLVVQRLGRLQVGVVRRVPAGAGQELVCPRMIGPQPDGSPIAVDRIVDTAHGAEQVTLVQRDARVARLQSRGTFVTCQSFCEPAEAPERHAQADQAAGVGGLGGHCASKKSLGRREFRDAVSEVAERPVCHRRCRSQAQGAVDDALCIIHPSELGERIGQVLPGGDESGIDLQRAFEPLDGSFRMPEPLLNCAEAMVCIGVGRVGAEYRATDFFGRRKLSGLQQLIGLRHRIAGGLARTGLHGRCRSAGTAFVTSSHDASGFSLFLQAYAVTGGAVLTSIIGKPRRMRRGGLVYHFDVRADDESAEVGSMARKNKSGRTVSAAVSPRSRSGKPGKIAFREELALAYQHMQAGRVADAESLYRQILARRKLHPQANLALGMLMDSRGRPGPAVEHLHCAARSLPDSVDAQLGLANNLRRLGRNEEALRYFRVVARLSPGNVAVFNNMGNICRELQYAEEAERYLSQAIELQPALPEAHNNLGALYSEQGRIDEAIAQFRQAIACRPDYAKAHRNLATTRKHTAHDDEVRAMERLVERPAATDFDRMQLGFGLGKAFADLGRHRRAFEYWSVANRCQRVLSPYDIQAGLGEIRAMQRIFDAPRLSAAEGASGKVVPVFVVGMPRSGTSLTEQILASHPQVHGAGELGLLGQMARGAVERYPADLSRLGAADWRRFGARYLAEIKRRSNGKRYVVDKLPGNFLCIGMIRMMLADARIIHCRRDPMDTGLSCFQNHFLGAGLGYTCDLDDLGSYYRHYVALMQHWQGVLPAGALHDNAYEALVASPETQIRALLACCGLPFDAGCLSFHETQRMVATASMAQVREPIHQRSVHRWKNYERELRPLRNALNGN